MTKPAIRVLLAEDQAIVRAGFRALLDREPDIVVAGEATTGTEAVQLAKELRPDLVVMDIRMPELDGLEATHTSPPTPPSPRPECSCSQPSSSTNTSSVPYEPAPAASF
jgi:CheY-like chemotaxis protein